MSKTLTQLRIVQRDNLFVVQIRKQKFFTRRWWWQDMKGHYSDIRGTWAKVRGVLEPPLIQAKFSTQEKAEIFCDKYLSKENKKIEPDEVIKTYNTGLNDINFGNPPNMPNVKPAKPELESGGTGIPPRPFKTHDDNYSRIE